MWLTIAGITLLAAIGFSVFAFALPWFQKVTAETNIDE